VSSQASKLDIRLVGYQVREADGNVIGEIEGVRPAGVRVHKITGHPGRAGYLPRGAFANVDAATNTVFLCTGLTIEDVLDAPPPPDETPDGWHKSDDWWADLLGHYGLFESEGRTSEPFLHPDQR
jgi:hypothetical protein